jgi:subtilisin family serine protease
MLLSIAAMGGNASPAVRSEETTSPADTSRMVLVMLHLPLQHYRPGASYGGSYTDRPGQAARRRIAQALAREHGLILVSDWPMPDIGVDCYVMRVPAERKIAEVVQRLSRDPRAEWVQSLQLFHTLEHSVAPGGDSLYLLQPSAKLWHLDELHKISTGRGVSVAIVDSGVDSGHPDLAGRIDVEQNFVDARPHVAESHGTAVAGIIGARADRGAGIVGIAPQANLMALRACWEASKEQTLCSSFTLAKALQFAIQDRAQVINMSLSGPEDKLVGRLLDAALERGATIVGAVDAQIPGGGFPASHPGVLAVSDGTARAASAPTLFAPGDDVPAPAPEGRWNFVSGSSFASAQVTGMVALMRELAPTMSMRQSAAWAQFPSGSTDGPAGAVDACNTLRRAVPAFSCSHTPDQIPQASR